MSLNQRNDNVNGYPALTGLLENFYGSDISNFGTTLKGTIPAVNIAENSNEFRIELAAPGMARENFEIKLDHSYLIITGQKDQRNEQSDEKYHRKEFKYASFRRSVSIPDTVDKANIHAAYKEGILEVTLPKKEEVKRMHDVKRISIS